jgi:hypothetical protein
MNTWFMIAQVFGIVTMVFEFISYQKKEKAAYFLTTGIGSLFWTLMFIAMGLATGMSTQMSLIVAGTYSTVRNLVFHVTFKRDTVKSNEFGIRFLLVMIVIALIAGVLSIANSPAEVRWLQTIGMVGALSFVVGQYWPGVHAVRITVVIYAVAVFLTQTPLNILEGDFRWNIMGMAIEAVKIISVIIFYAKNSKEPNGSGLQLAKV